MLEHNEHDNPEKESTYLDLRVNGKLHRKTGTTAVFNRQIAIYINMPTLTVINIIKMTSNQNAPKRWIGVHTEHNHPKKNQLIWTYESTGNRFAKQVHEAENLGLRNITGMAE